jgi:prepilin-type N-terminal cleavage/methylation domain-containing protein
MNATQPIRRAQAGFTLVELMAVVVIISVLMAVAVVRIRRSSYNVSVYGYAEELDSEVDSMRNRAIATKRWQRLEVDHDTVIHYEANFQGLRVPNDDEWVEVRTISSPGDVFVASLDDVTHLNPGSSVPAVGAGLGGTVDFAPDGAGQAATLFIGEESDRDRARLVIYRATGASYVYDQW